MNSHFTDSLIPLVLATVVALALAVALMSVRVILKKNGRFRQGHACRFDPSKRHGAKTPPPLPKKKTN